MLKQNLIKTTKSIQKSYTQRIKRKKQVKSKKNQKLIDYQKKLKSKKPILLDYSKNFKTQCPGRFNPNNFETERDKFFELNGRYNP